MVRSPPTQNATSGMTSCETPTPQAATASMPCPAPAPSNSREFQTTPMGMMKNYMLELLHRCSDQQLGQDAVEWAVVSGRIRLSYNLEADLRLIMGEPGKPETGKF